MGVQAKPFGKNTWLLLVVVGILYLFQKFGGDINGLVSSDSEEKTEEISTENTKSEVHSNLLDEELVYTKHAKCRMDCRKISKSEVEDVLRNGKVNWRKSKKEDKPCPSYALEGNTKDGQTVRIVFADCNNATKVITAIDLKNKYDCYCP